MDCSCDFDPAAFYQASTRKARKSHRCYDCSGQILPGEKYEYVAAVWEPGDPMSSVHTCERCYDIRIFVRNNVPCFCYMHGGLDEKAEEAIEDAYYRAPQEVVGLRFGYMRRLILRRRHNQQRRRAA